MNIGIILLAGKGVRLDKKTPKQFLLVNDKPLFFYSVNTFNSNKNIDKILLVTDIDHIDYVSGIVKENNLNKVMDVIKGGDSRIESTLNALSYLRKFAKDDDIVLIHDAARVLVSSTLISNLIKECKVSDAVTPAIKVKDTIIKANDSNVDGYANREELYINQTPQTFKYGLIYNAHKHIDKNKSYTDDVSIAIDDGTSVKVILGEETNFKVTTKEDLELLKYYLNKVG